MSKKKIYIRNKFEEPIEKYVRISLCSPNKLSIFFKEYLKWKKGLRKFSISSQHDLKEIFSTKIQQGLIKLDFIPKIHRRNPDQSLNVRILNIRSYYSERLPRMDVRINSKIQATCKNNGKQYSKTFSAQKNRPP